MSAIEYKAQLHEAVLNLLWRQWAALGVAGHAKPQGGAAVLDPEALLIFTARFARCDQRLYDLVLNWLLHYEFLINLPRLKALLKKSTWQDKASLAYMATVAVAEGHRRWKVLTDFPSRPSGEYELLFRAYEAAETAYIPHADAVAESCGFRRNDFERGHKIAPRLPRGSASLLLTLRGHVGVSARAELVLLLLCSPYCSLAELAERSGYARSSVHELLAELLAAQVAEQSHSIGKKEKKLIALRRAEEWKRLLGVESPCIFPRWGLVYDALGTLLSAVSSPRLETLSETTFCGEIARVMKQGGRQAFLQCGLPELQGITAETYTTLPAALDLL